MEEKSLGDEDKNRLPRINILPFGIQCSLAAVGSDGNVCTETWKGILETKLVPNGGS